MPLNFWNLLNSTTISSVDTRSLLQVLQERLDAGYGTGTPKPRKIIAIPTLDQTQSMVILPTDVEQCGAGVWDLEEVDMGVTSGGSVYSQHCGATAGLIVTHPQSAIIYQLNY